MKFLPISRQILKPLIFRVKISAKSKRDRIPHSEAELYTSHSRYNKKCANLSAQIKPALLKCDHLARSGLLSSLLLLPYFRKNVECPKKWKLSICTTFRAGSNDMRDFRNDFDIGKTEGVAGGRLIRRQRHYMSFYIEEHRFTLV